MHIVKSHQLLSQVWLTNSHDTRIEPFCLFSVPAIKFIAIQHFKQTIDFFVGELTHWNFYFTKSPCLLVHIAQGNRHKTVNLDGYNYAYQVKLVTDAMAEVGFFD